MDKREAQEVVNETVNGLVGGYIMALIVIAALPVVGWVLLLGLAGAIAFPGTVALVVAGLIAWAWLSGVRRQAGWARERAARDARSAQLKAPHGGKDRYFIRDGDKITLMSFYRNEGDSSDVGGYVQDTAYYLYSNDPVWTPHPRTPDARNDPKRLAHWQAVFEDWIETGVRPPGRHLVDVPRRSR